MRESAVGNGLAAELNLERVGSWFPRRIHDADRAVSVVDDVDVDIALNVAANATSDAAFAGFRRVEVYDAFLTDGNHRTNRICQPISRSTDCQALRKAKSVRGSRRGMLPYL